MSTTKVEELVRRYVAAVADLGVDEAEVAELLDPELELVEHPNSISPTGSRTDRAGALAGLRAGRELLAEQSFVITALMVDEDRVALQATWSGVTAHDRGPLAAGTRLMAEIGAFVTVRDGRILRHETYDCYLPPRPPAPERR
jgi:ketosteroid isomerase-like protein